MKTRVSCILYLVSAVLMAALMFTGCPNDPPEPDPVPTVAVTGVTLNGAQGTAPSYTLNVPKGSTRTLTAVIAPDGATNRAVNWTTSNPLIAVAATAGNPLVATITPANNVQVNATATITVKTADGNFTATCTVTIVDTEVMASTVTINGPTGTNSSHVLPNDTVNLTAKIAPANSTTTSVTWTSSNTGVATVASTGGLAATVTAVSEGQSIIKAIADDDTAVEGEYTIIVTNTPAAVTGVTLSPKTLTLGIGEDATLTHTIAPANATTTSVTWSSSDPDKATVAEGTVIAVAVGTVTITVTTTDGGKTDTCEVTVTYAKNSVVADGAQLVHYYPALKGTTAWGADLGTNNDDDGSYTFDGTAANWNGGGAFYKFPEPKPGETWDIADYDIIEVYLTVLDGSMRQVVRKSGENARDSRAYPSGGQYMEDLTGDVTPFKLVLAELTGGIGFQRGQGGPATWAITKVVYTKGTWHTITFNGGIYPDTEEPVNIEPIDPLKVIDGRTVNFYDFYKMPSKPRSAGYTFDGWYNTTDSEDFATGAAITKDLTLTAKWIEGEIPLVDITLELDPENWNPVLPGPPNNVTAAAYAYANDALTFTFATVSGTQIAGIPLTTAQVAALQGIDAPISITIDGDVTINGVAANDTKFRFHLAKFDSGSNWNATDTGVGYITFATITEGQDYAWHENKAEATLASLRIQIENAPTTYPVIVTIRSVNIVELD